MEEVKNHSLQRSPTTGQERGGAYFLPRFFVGFDVGFVGFSVDFHVGFSVDFHVGVVGFAVGFVGFIVGFVGFAVGAALGLLVGVSVGKTEGRRVFFVGKAVGSAVFFGFLLGAKEGAMRREEGFLLGCGDKDPGMG